MFERPEGPPTRLNDSSSETNDLGVADLDEALHPKVSPRRRAIQIGAVLVVVVVVAALLLHGSRPSQPGTASVGPGTPVPPTVVITSNVTFGTVTVNGRTLKSAPPLVTHFRFGDNVVTLAAPPFRPRTCHFLFPSDQPSAEPGCSGGISAGSAVNVNGVSVAPDAILTVMFSSADLPPGLLANAYVATASARACSGRGRCGLCLSRCS
jgi:hypothetical protein